MINFENNSSIPPSTFRDIHDINIHDNNNLRTK